MRFDIVDVFAETKYAGNQLAVVRDAGALSSEEMQRIAFETHFSETTFVVSEEAADDRGRGFSAPLPRTPSPQVRIFTPTNELPFAGHPTLGTGALLMDEARADHATLHLPVGPIRVTRDANGVVWMRQNAATFGARHDAKDMAAILGIDPHDVDATLPIEDVSTGLAHTIVPLASLDALRRVTIDLPRYWAWANGGGAATKSILVTARGGATGRVVRVFPIAFGIHEDPATGSAAGCLAAYLAHHSGRPVDERVAQGAEVGRPSLLHLRAASPREVDVGGRVQHVVRGELVG